MLMECSDMVDTCGFLIKMLKRLGWVAIGDGVLPHSCPKVRVLVFGPKVWACCHRWGYGLLTNWITCPGVSKGPLVCAFQWASWEIKRSGFIRHKTPANLATATCSGVLAGWDPGSIVESKDYPESLYWLHAILPSLWSRGSSANRHRAWLAANWRACGSAIP